MNILHSHFTIYLSTSITNFITKSSKINYINRDIVEELIKKGKKVIFAFWHQRFFLLIPFHNKFNVAIMVSPSNDGKFLSRLLRKFCYCCIEGSSRRGWCCATKEMLKCVENGYNLAIAVDGPKGPIYEVKKGILFIAQKTNSIIIPVSSSAKKRIIFKKSWDNYILPLPFTRAVIGYGNPIYVSPNDDIELKKIELKNELDRITSICDREVNL